MYLCKTSVISKVIYILLKSSSWPLAGLAPPCHCCLVLKSQHRKERWPSRVQERGRMIPFNLLTILCLTWRRYCWPALLQGHVSGLWSTGASLQSCSSDELYIIKPGFTPSRGRTWCVPLLKLWRFLLAPFSSLSRHL